jgi:hypothetical protein
MDGLWQIGGISRRTASLRHGAQGGETMEAGTSSPRPARALIDLSIEGWRFARLFAKVCTKLDAGEAQRYANQLRYFQKRIEETLEAAGLRLVNLEGQPYDPGLPATALNVGDFPPEMRLYVEQMLEPVIMGPDGLVKTGTIMLRGIN